VNRHTHRHIDKQTPPKTILASSLAGGPVNIDNKFMPTVAYLAVLRRSRKFEFRRNVK